jgi:uncharacterized protein YecE (DUF72 family)
MIYIGTAGWSLPRDVADQFPGTDAHLARYARVFSCAEIHSSFPRAAKQLFTLLRECHAGPAVCEPRHESWFNDRADTLMSFHKIARVAADPAHAATAHQPGGWIGSARDRSAFVYFRLHGSPRKYWSAYSDEYVAALAKTLRNFPRSKNQ